MIDIKDITQDSGIPRTVPMDRRLRVMDGVVIQGVVWDVVGGIAYVRVENIHCCGDVSSGSSSGSPEFGTVALSIGE